jgi:Mor family transcriptional regulator
MFLKPGTNFSKTVHESNGDPTPVNVRKDWSGMAVYIPKGHEYEISKRDLQIYNRFDGSNHARVAHEFDLTERQVYKIVKRVREVEFHKRQLKLFE